MFLRSALNSRKTNRTFRSQHPDFAVPPLYALWDAQSHTNFSTYYESGRKAAQMYWAMLRQHCAPRHTLRVLEWGCGPARIVRHLPALALRDEVRAEFFASDYNHTSIRWAQRNVPGVVFTVNRLAPPLPYEDGFFDFVYCRSVFTHLSERMHFAWIEELRRVTKTGGLLCISTAGAAHSHRMRPQELELFSRGQLVVRPRAKEGRMRFSVFHPPAFVRDRLLAGLTILRHETPPNTQELWLAVKQP